MIHVNDLKNGMSIKFEGQIYQVLEFLHVKPGKGPAFVRVKLKNLRAGSTIDKTFNTSVRFEKAVIEKIEMQYLYASGDKFNFMNMETFEQIELEKDQIEEQLKYLKEGLSVTVIFCEGELLGLILPEKVQYKIIDTESASKGNTVNNATKEAIIENGTTIKVPMFVKADDEIIVSTKTGLYDSRV